MSTGRDRHPFDTDVSLFFFFEGCDDHGGGEQPHQLRQWIRDLHVLGRVLSSRSSLA